MKEQKLRVKLRKPIAYVFEFTTDPEKTPLWIDSIVKEAADSARVGVGTVIRNWDKEGHMNEYRVTRYEPPHLFQLESTLQDYNLRYTYTPLSETETELEYYEWSESGQLHSSSMDAVLQKLCKVIEE